MQSAPAEAKDPRLGVIILGASGFPHFPSTRRLDNESFARSARAFRALIETPDAMLLGTPAVLDLFDAEDDPARIVRRMRSFLGEGDLTDVVIYYCGHGDFLADAHKSYILTLRSTEPDNEAFTALPLRQMRLSLDSQLAMKRVFLILDCCFAGKAATEWQADGIGHVIEDQVFQSFPKRGTALIAASAKGMPAVAPEGESLTMFTGMLVEVVRDGLKGTRQQLSFRDVFQAVKARIVDRYGARAATPVIHAPHQPEGDISFEPFFVNRGYIPPALPKASLAEREHFDLADADLDRPLTSTRIAAVEVLADLHAKARSAAFRAEIVERLARVRDEDDSSSVKLRAGRALESFAAGIEADVRGDPAGKPAAQEALPEEPAPPKESSGTAKVPAKDETAKHPLPWWRHLIEGAGTLAGGLAFLAIGAAALYFVAMFGGMIIDKAGEAITYVGSSIAELVTGNTQDQDTANVPLSPTMSGGGPVESPMSPWRDPSFPGGSLADQLVKGAIPGSTTETPPAEDSPFKVGQ